MRKILFSLFVCTVSVLMFPFGSKAEGKMADTVGSAGVGSILDTIMTEEEYLTAAEDTSFTYGYTNLGVADVENHLNVREAPSTDAKLVGKMSICTFRLSFNGSKGCSSCKRSGHKDSESNGRRIESQK